MEGLRFIKDYKNIDRYRRSFNDLAKSIFGIDFEGWYQLGLWNDRYVCYSYADGDRIVSNVSVNIIEIIINGKRKRAVQLGTVMTHPDYRGRGLAGSLMNIVLEEYEKKCDIVYLFPNENVLGFYLKFGFLPYQESTLSREIDIEGVDGGLIRKLDISNKEDFKLLIKLAGERIPNSLILGADGAEHILTWYLVNGLSDNIYYLEDRDMVVLYDVEGDRLNLYDVISRKAPDIDEVINRIVNSEVKRVIFHFTPQPQYVGEYEKIDNPDDLLYIKGDIDNMPEYFRHPITAHA